MENYQTIAPELEGPIVTLWLSRPEVHNALNDIMIREISSFFLEIEGMNEIQMVILKGQGKSFCSGADLQWMKNASSLSAEENLRACKELSDMFSAIFNSSKITVAAVHGNVFGGGNGLVAACDLAYGMSETRFSLSETRVGMAAVSITPYLLQKIRASDLKELIFSAKSFNGEGAVKIGLLNQSFETTETLDRYIHEITTQILANGRQALITSKRLINRITIQTMEKEMEQIPELLAQIRVSQEAREGFSAFLEKRKPNW